MNITLSVEDQKTQRLAGQVDDVPAAHEALSELDAARAVEARAQAKLDAATAIAVEWDALKQWRADLHQEIAETARHLVDMKERLEEERRKTLPKLVRPFNTLAEPVSRLVLLEKLVNELLPQAIAKAEAELKEAQEEMIAFAEMHNITARVEDSGPEPPQATAVTVSAPAPESSPGEDVDEDADDPTPPPPLRGSRRRT